MNEQEMKQKAVEEFKQVLRRNFQYKSGSEAQSNFYEGCMIGQRALLMELGILTDQEIDEIALSVFTEHWGRIKAVEE